MSYGPVAPATATTERNGYFLCLGRQIQLEVNTNPEPEVDVGHLADALQRVIDIVGGHSWLSQASSHQRIRRTKTVWEVTQSVSSFFRLGGSRSLRDPRFGMIGSPQFLLDHDENETALSSDSGAIVS